MPTTEQATPQAHSLGNIPTLQPGEHYAGITLDAEGTPTLHLVLMPQRPDGELTWQAAMDWSASIGGTLPTRQEQALLFANCKPHIERYEGCAVAVRRLVIKSFNPLDSGAL